MRIERPAFERAGMEVWMKRDDLIHEEISGNKARKLLPVLNDFPYSGKTGILTVGGAYSNHIAAVAAAGREMNIPTVAVIRGEEADHLNPTLSYATQQGMKITYADRDTYRRYRDDATLLVNKYPDHYLIAEGGKGVAGALGSMAILEETTNDYDLVTVPCGTGTTLAGLILSASEGTKVTGFAVFKEAPWMVGDVQEMLDEAMPGLGFENISCTWEVTTHDPYGGYAKWTPELLEYITSFYDSTGVLLDPVYTSKMMLGLEKKALSGLLPEGIRVLAIHTGGLQGWLGFEERWGIRRPDK